MRSVLAAGRACAVTCWLPPLPPRSSPPVHPGHRTPARLAGPLWCFAARPLPLLPPPLSAGGSGAVAIRPCPARGPVRPGPAQGGGGSGSVRIAGRLGECSGVRGGRAGLAATSAPHSLGGATLLVPHVPAAARKGRRCVPSVAPPQLLAALPAPPVRGATLGLPARLCGRPERQRGGEPAVGTCGGPCAERGGFVVGTGCPPVRYVGCWGCRAALG